MKLGVTQPFDELGLNGGRHHLPNSKMNSFFRAAVLASVVSR
jgi:hypothetical protein